MTVIANYGYADGSGEYFIAIDTDKCDGCGECIKACPRGVFEVARDDWDNLTGKVRDEFAKNISYVCPGYEKCRTLELNCHTACAGGAISHSW